MRFNKWWSSKEVFDIESPLYSRPILVGLGNAGAMI